MNQPTAPRPGELILAYLDRAITATARTASKAAFEYGPAWYYDDGLVVARREDEMVATGSQGLLEREQGDHIALHDPQSVLRRCASDRKLIAELAAVINGDYIDDGEPVLAERVLCGIAEGYGWTEAPR